MATTYITLCNDLLRRLNEVTFDTSGDGFSGAKNIQAIAKDAINNSIREILQDGHQFPFLKTTTTQTMTAGTGTYDFPSDLASVDCDTVYIKEDDDMMRKIEQVISRLQSFSKETINENVLLTVLKTQSLVQEIYNGDNN